MYQTILLDLDGTLTDPGNGITNSVAYALKKWNIEVSDKTTLYKFIGPPLQESFEKYYHFSEEEAKQAVAYYREYFKDTGIYENELYPGIKDLLQKLKKSGKTLILATSKPEEFAVRILEYFDIAQYFDYVAGASMDETRNKKVDVIAYALEKANIKDYKKAIMIGDREYDINGAKHFGIDSIGVLYGYGSYEELSTAGATHIVENVADIFSLVSV